MDAGRYDMLRSFFLPLLCHPNMQPKFVALDPWHSLLPLFCIEGRQKTLMQVLINSVRLRQQHRGIYMGQRIPGRLGYRERLLSGSDSCFSNGIEHFCCCPMTTDVFGIASIRGFHCASRLSPCS